MTFSKFRVSLYKLHAIFGLYVFGIMALLFLSGSILVFVWEIDRAVNKDIGLSQPATSFDARFGQVFDNLKAFDPALSPVFMQRSKDANLGDRTFVRDRQSRWFIVWSHPDTAEILSVTKKDGLREIFFAFHQSFMIPNRVGFILTNSFAIILLGFVLTGLWSYRKFWHGLFRMPPRHLGARGWWGGVHRLVAVWTFPFLILMGVNGAYFLSTSLGFLRAPLPAPQQVSPRTDRIPAGFSGADLDRAIEIARDALPGLQITVVNLPFSKSKGIVVFGHTGRNLQSPAASRAVIDPVTFELLAVNRAQDNPALRKFAGANLLLHTGDWGGFYGRLLWFGLGLAGAFLMFAGAMIYASRLANTEGSKGRNAAGRIWHGMGILKWGLVLYVVGVIAMGIIQFAL